MFPNFFKHKMREVGAFFKIISGKATMNDQKRKEGVKDALNAMKDEKSVYEEEYQEARKGVDSDTPTRPDPQEKVMRESGGQDITAI